MEKQVSWGYKVVKMRILGGSGQMPFFIGLSFCPKP